MSEKDDEGPTGATRAFLAAFGLLPRQAWQWAREMVADGLSYDETEPSGNILLRGRGLGGEDVVVPIADYQERAHFLQAHMRAQARLVAPYLLRRDAFLVAPYITKDEERRFALEEEARAWQAEYDGLPGWLRKRLGPADYSSPFAAGRRWVAARPPSADLIAARERIDIIMADELAAQRRFGERLRAEAGLDPEKRKLVAARLKVEDEQRSISSRPPVPVVTSPPLSPHEEPETFSAYDALAIEMHEANAKKADPYSSYERIFKLLDEQVAIDKLCLEHYQAQSEGRSLPEISEGFVRELAPVIGQTVNARNRWPDNARLHQSALDGFHHSIRELRVYRDVFGLPFSATHHDVDRAYEQADFLTRQRVVWTEDPYQLSRTVARIKEDSRRYAAARSRPSPQVQRPTL